jgi:retron-type reverse transcriptase
LFSQFANFKALLAACDRAAKGKRGKPGAAAFLANREPGLLHMLDALQDGTWQPGPYKVLHVKEPKARRVSAAPFADRVLHQALCQVITPLFERSFVADSFANRLGFGTHRAVARYEHYRDRFAHVLRCDIWRYFPSMDHAVLKADIRRRIACPATLVLLDKIIDGSNAQEPVNLYFEGDDLFTPFGRQRGLPIGNLTSQLFGNVYLNPMDHFVKEVLRAPGYVRYVDDFALFHDDPAVLAQWQQRLALFLAQRRLLLHPRKTQIEPTAMPALFLGYVLHPTHRALPQDNVRRFRNRLNSLRDRWRAGAVDEVAVRQRVGAWIAHAQHAKTWRLRQTMFKGGWFAPGLLEPGP